MIQDLFSSGAVVDAVIAVMVIEFGALAWVGRSRGRLSARRLAPNFAAGLCLLLAVRLALAGASWPWLAVCLAGAGAAHVMDLCAR